MSLWVCPKCLSADSQTSQCERCGIAREIATIGTGTVNTLPCPPCAPPGMPEDAQRIKAARDEHLPEVSQISFMIRECQRRAEDATMQAQRADEAERKLAEAQAEVTWLRVAVEEYFAARQRLRAIAPDA